jgi:flagellar basal-body rod protein FlgB
MGIHFDKALDTHGQALQLRAERTRILASNIANESTPDYKARDMDFRASMASAAAGDDPTVPLLGEDDGVTTGFRVPTHPVQDGNTVELGVEQAEFAQNAADFQMSLTFIDMKLKGIAKAISGQ